MDKTILPQLVTNRKDQKVLSALEKELKDCDDMFMSVAFITMGGITPLLGHFRDLEKRNIKGKILTTDYLVFSDPKALDKLNCFKNIDLRVFKTGENDVGFHTKGYMFHNNDKLRILIGSSNLTQDAISKNHEWNTRIISSDEDSFARDVKCEFNQLWKCSVNYDEYQEEYKQIYNEKAILRRNINEITKKLNNNASIELYPNMMQSQFIANVEDIVHRGGKRAMLISATGTGKTYASAFAIRKLLKDKEDKILFLSHREQINNQARTSYQRVFGLDVSMYILSGNHNDINEAKCAKFLFSTMNMMAKDEIRYKFDEDEFAYIILDECHRSGSNSYQKIIDYFLPKFLLGMSASPDRTDGIDVYSLFHHNIACEIRLQQALENNMLCPFHYFGITDIEIDNITKEKDTFRFLTSEKRVDYVIKQAEYYGFSGKRVKGLIFCSSKDEAKELSKKFNQTKKYKTLFLSGDNKQKEREDAIDRLVTDDEKRDDKLDYIFTIDIFNEGVDIPEINQVIMLRPTESPIVFVQQLGRGLRKMEGKEFVVIIDFIGNYENNNYMIPIALSGDRSGNKDNMRRCLLEGNNMIDGASTVYFDEISRKRIFDSIDKARLNTKRNLINEYTILKNKLGRIPTLVEFDNFGELDPIRIISYSGSYHNFKISCQEKDYEQKFTPNQEKILEYVSTKFASGKRIPELLFIKQVIEKPSEINEWTDILKNKYQIELDDLTESSLKNVLSIKFFRTNLDCPSLIDTDSENLKPSSIFLQELENKNFRIEMLDVITLGINRYERNYSNNYKGLFLNLYKKYTYAEVCWLLNWEKEEVSLNIGGYKFDKHSNTYPVFINYEKENEIAATTKYEDRFVDNYNLIAISKSKRTLKSEDVVTAMHSDDKNIVMPLFVRKNKDDKTSKEFYFLGKIRYNGYSKEFIMPKTENISAVEIGYHLETMVEDGLFGYLTDK